jgi:protein phosphatase 1B
MDPQHCWHYISLSLCVQDHKPSNEPERERIQNAGGTVMIQRVNGSLAVSRALGDFEYKNVEGKGPTEQLVSPEPEFFIKVAKPPDLLRESFGSSRVVDPH